MPWHDYQHNPSNTKLLKSALGHVRQAIRDVEKLNIHTEDKRFTLKQLRSAESVLESGHAYEKAIGR